MQHRAELSRIIELFDQAEAKIKRAERLSSTITVPSVNELRYVGYHLTKALLAEDEPKLNDEISKATAHCQRAIYDANEVGILYLLEKISLFQTDYAMSTEVIGVVPNYVDLLRQTTEAQSLLEEARADVKENRSKYYERTEPHFQTLRQIHQTLEIARPEINKRAKSSQFKNRLAVVAVVIAFLGLTLAGLRYVPEIIGALPTSAAPSADAPTQQP